MYVDGADIAQAKSSDWWVEAELTLWTIINFSTRLTSLLEVGHNRAQSRTMLQAFKRSTSWICQMTISLLLPGF